MTGMRGPPFVRSGNVYDWAIPLTSLRGIADSDWDERIGVEGELKPKLLLGVAASGFTPSAQQGQTRVGTSWSKLRLTINRLIDERTKSVRLDLAQRLVTGELLVDEIGHNVHLVVSHRALQLFDRGLCILERRR